MGGKPVTQAELAEMLISQSGKRCSPLVVGGLGALKSMTHKRKGRKGNGGFVNASTNATFSNRTVDACAANYTPAFRDACKPACGKGAKNKRVSRMQTELNQRIASLAEVVSGAARAGGG